MNQAVSDNGTPKLNAGRRTRLTLAGKPRNQEANRKRLVIALEKIENLGIKASAIRAKLESINVETISNNQRPVKKVLLDAVDLEDHLVTARLCELLGIDGREMEYHHELRCAIVHRLYGVENQECTASRPRLGASVASEGNQLNQQPPLTSDAALAEAFAIARQAADDAVEFDWTRNPVDGREAEWRLAIIRRIEVEGMDRDKEIDRLDQSLERLFPGLKGEPKAERAHHAASNVYWALRALLPEDIFDDEGSSIGDDLSAAIQRWELSYDEELKRNKLSERRHLQDRARRDISRGKGMGLT